MAAHEHDADGDPGLAEIGLAMRASRRRLGMSVQQLAERAGLSLGLVSQLERGLGNPSLQTLRNLADGLSMPLAQLVQPALEDVSVVRSDARHLLPVPDGPPEQQVVRELLTPRGETTLQMIRSTLPVGFSNESQPFRRLGSESVTVEQGRLLLVHGEQRILLEAGDSATYGCSVPHWWANDAAAETIVLGAVSAFER